MPLPAHPFPCDAVQTLRSGKTPYLRFDGNDYSIPHSLVRKPLMLVASDRLVRVLDGDDEVASHQRSWERGRQIEDRRHLDGALRLPVHLDRHPRDAQEVAGASGRTEPLRSPPERPVEPTGGGDEQTRRALNRRMGDWSPAPLGSDDPDVEERLRRRQEAQHAVDRKLARPGDLVAQPSRGPPGADDKRPPPGPSPLERGGDGVDKSKLALGRRRYDWSPAVDGGGAITRGSRGPGPDRGR